MSTKSRMAANGNDCSSFVFFGKQLLSSLSILLMHWCYRLAQQLPKPHPLRLGRVTFGKPPFHIQPSDLAANAALSIQPWFRSPETWVCFWSCPCSVFWLEASYCTSLSLGCPWNLDLLIFSLSYFPGSKRALKFCGERCEGSPEPCHMVYGDRVSTCLPIPRTPRTGSPTAHPSPSLDVIVASLCVSVGPAPLLSPRRGEETLPSLGLGALLRLCSEPGSELPSPSFAASHL